jgi:hypothetical protein
LKASADVLSVVVIITCAGAQATDQISITLLDNCLGGIWFEPASRDDFSFKDFPQLLGRDWRLSLLLMTMAFHGHFLSSELRTPVDWDGGAGDPASRIGSKGTR